MELRELGGIGLKITPPRPGLVEISRQEQTMLVESLRSDVITAEEYPSGAEQLALMNYWRHLTP